MTDQTFSELRALAQRAQRIFDSEASWEVKFELILSDDLAQRVYTLDPNFTYSDPDTTYEDDTTAFVRALVERVSDLQLAFAGP